jgi:hypothetical protein
MALIDRDRVARDRQSAADSPWIERLRLEAGRAAGRHHEYAERLSDQLRRALVGWSDGGRVPLAPVVLPAATIERVERAAEDVRGLVRLLAVELAGGAPRELARLIRLPEAHWAWRMLDSIGSAGAEAIERATAICRPDVILAGGRPVLVDLNFDSVLGGFWQVDVVAEAMLATTLGLDIALGTGLSARSNLAAQVALLADRAGPDHQAFSLTLEANRREGFWKYFDRECAYAARHGLVLRALDPLEYLATAHPAQAPALRRFNLGVAQQLGVPVEALCDLERRAGIRYLGSALCPLLSATGMSALLWRSRGALGAAAAELVRAHIPWSTFVADDVCECDRPGCPGVVAHALADRERLLLKRGVGGGGFGVLFGAEVTASEWSAHLERAAGEGGWVIQERVEADRSRVAAYDPDRGAILFDEVPVLLGPYLCGEHRGGMLARFRWPGVGAAAGVNWDHSVVQLPVFRAC